MDINKLFLDLIDAYSDENLNKITTKLILLYKSKNYGKIREIYGKVSKYMDLDEEKDARCFPKLIMLYHPDKGEQLRKEIHLYYKRNDYQRLENFKHILLIGDFSDFPITTIDPAVDYEPEYGWDMETGDGYSITDMDGTYDLTDNYESVDYERSFYNMIKIREYGNVDIEFPPYYLEDFEEFEMANSGLDSLDGVEYCSHIKILDVSNNAISDLKNLWELKDLSELYLADNQILDVDVLSNLIHLKVLDLSGNQIYDISPLLDLDNLEFINLIGNPVPADQVKQLKDRGVIVMTEYLHAN